MKKVMFWSLVTLLLTGALTVSLYCGLKSQHILSESVLLFNLEALTQNESGDYPCSSGGPGANSCSVNFSGGIKTGDFSTGCTVTCNPGYYACCNAYYNKCQCRKEA